MTKCIQYVLYISPTLHHTHARTHVRTHTHARTHTHTHTHMEANLNKSSLNNSVKVGRCFKSHQFCKKRNSNYTANNSHYPSLWQHHPYSHYIDKQRHIMGQVEITNVSVSRKEGINFGGEPIESCCAEHSIWPAGTACETKLFICPQIP